MAATFALVAVLAHAATDAGDADSQQGLRWKRELREELAESQPSRELDSDSDSGSDSDSDSDNDSSDDEDNPWTASRAALTNETNKK